MSTHFQSEVHYLAYVDEGSVALSASHGVAWWDLSAFFAGLQALIAKLEGEANLKIEGLEIKVQPTDPQQLGPIKTIRSTKVLPVDSYAPNAPAKLRVR
jgi:hypothetical protein